MVNAIANTPSISPEPSTQAPTENPPDTPEPSTEVPTPTPTNWVPTTLAPATTEPIVPAPSRDEILQYALSSLDEIEKAGAEDTVTKQIAHQIVEKNKEDLLKNVTTWFSSEQDRIDTETYLDKYYTTLFSCVDIAIELVSVPLFEGNSAL